MCGKCFKPNMKKVQKWDFDGTSYAKVSNWGKFGITFVDTPESREKAIKTLQAGIKQIKALG